MPRRGLILKNCSPACCRKSHTLSDDEFDDMQSTPLTDRVVEEAPVAVEGQLGHPHVSTGSLPEGSPVNIVKKMHPESPGERKVEIGPRERDYLPDDTDSSSDEDTNEEETHQKSVHFAVCHEPEVKDTRDQYRRTPVKEKRPRPKEFEEEQMFVKAKDSDEFVRISIANLKSYVHEYVRKIVQSALTAVAREDFDARFDDVTRPDDVRLKERKTDEDTESTDDGIDVSSSEETDLISAMVDEMIADITRSMTLENQQKSDTRAEESGNDVSTVTSDSVRQIESISSLEWDGYEHLLRENSPQSDITAGVPAAPAKS